MIRNHFRALSENLDLRSFTYDKFIVLGDFNVEMGHLQIKSFCDVYSLSNYEAANMLQKSD